jgi:hypothetical protein
MILLQILAGASAGLVSALCMVFFEVPFWKKCGMTGVAEWQVNSVMLSVIIRKPAREISVVASVAMHVLHGVVLGAVYGLFLIFIPKITGFPDVVLIANLYSLILWSVSPFATRRLFESKGAFQIKRRGLAVSLASHVIYGSVLGLLLFLFV